VTVPFVAVLDPLLPVLAESVPAIDRYIRSRTSWAIDEVTVISVSLGVERLVAAMVTALTALVIFAIARTQLGIRNALFITLLFAFATPAWSVASRAMWQHGPSMLCLSIALYALLRLDNGPRWIAVTGAALAFAYIIRPTNAIPIVIWTAFIAIRTPKQLPYFFLGALPFAVAFMAYNVWVYGHIFAPYYLPQRVGATGTLGEALAANLISPGRGLFVYSPIFLLSFAGIYIRVRQRTFGLLDASLIAIVILHWVSVSSFPHWWGGHSYGPRFMSDITPLLLVMLLPVFGALPKLHRLQRTAAVLAITALTVISVYMHSRGALVKAGWEWNAIPTHLDQSHERVWDWSDPAFLRREQKPL
jgi:hypothetical protein